MQHKHGEDSPFDRYLDLFTWCRKSRTRTISAVLQYLVVRTANFRATGAMAVVEQLPLAEWSWCTVDPFARVNPSGRKHATLGTVSQGWGPAILEIVSPAFESLDAMVTWEHQIAAVMHVAASRAGVMLVAAGYQPVSMPRWPTTPVYGVMRRALGAGALGLANTAQISIRVDIERRELHAALDALNALSGPLEALMANSCIANGALDERAVVRRSVWDNLDHSEVRVIPTEDLGARDDRGVTMRQIVSLVHLIVPNGKDYTVGRMPLSYLLQEKRTSEELYYWLKRHMPIFERGVWLPARPRAFIRSGVVEYRSACAQPVGGASALGAMVFGLIRSRASALDFVKSANGRTWEKLYDHRKRVPHEGVRAHFGRSDPTQLYETILQLAHPTRGTMYHGQLIGDIMRQLHLDRVNRVWSPAEEVRTLFRRGGIDRAMQYLEV